MSKSDKFSELLADSALKGRAENRKAFYALRNLQNAYGHFVPKDFLDFLGAKDISEVTPGVEVEMNMTIMFSDIRNFTSLSETMTSHQTFDFINSYLANMESPIHRHGGLIDKFIGDAIMALFPKSADDALNGAIAMIEALKQYNANREKMGWVPVEIGIGLNTGLSSMGVVGHSERMETTVIGDSVNVASRMEGLTKKYHTPILISEDTLIALSDPTKYCIRFVDRVLVKGRHRPLSVYEVFDGDEREMTNDKLEGLEVFEKAVAYYHLKEIDEAQEQFEKYLNVIPNDLVAKRYLDLCLHYKKTGVYDGIGELQEKVEWRDDFNTGHGLVDKQHQNLLTNINALSQSLQKGDLDQVRDILPFLEQYVVEHFGTEQELMDQYNYPFTEMHRQEHYKFVKRVATLKEELISDSQDKLYSLFRVNLFLYDWLISHSTRVDKHLITYVLEHQNSQDEGS